MPETPLGRICWYELLTTDTAGADEFYSSLLGWEVGKWQGDGPEYHTWRNGGGEIGGLMELPEDAQAAGAPPHWMVYISTPDLEDTVNKSLEEGAKLCHRFEIPEVGEIAIITDPGGTTFTAYQPSGFTPGHDGMPEIGEFAWHEIVATDRKAVFSFYSKVFGWHETSRMEMGSPDNIYQMYGRGDQVLGGMMDIPKEVPVPCWFLYVRVEDVQESAGRIEELGGIVTTQPMQVPGGGWILHAIDPQGAAFALHNHPPE